MKKKFLLYTVSVFIALVIGVAVPAQQTAQKFIQEVHYLLSLPEGYNADTAQRWPLMVFLHGSGESGVDLNKVKVHGPPKLLEQGKKFPFIVISPQATNGWKPDQLKAMLDDIKKQYRVDGDRVYLTGLSMGGYGTWALAMEYPGEFAAIAPICGGGDTTKIFKLRYMPVWCFHGAKDNVVPVSSSYKMINALKPYNPTVKLTVYPEANHDSWTETYNNDSLYSWLLSKRKFRYTEQPVQKELLNEYTGSYSSDNNDMVKIFIKEDKLFADAGGEIIQLTSSGAETFFIDAGSIVDLQFTRTKGKVNSFVFKGNEVVRFKKLPAVKK